jgi:hypothetical protein
MFTMTGGPTPNMISSRRRLYADVLSQLRYIIIGRMAKPEEVLIVENEQGEIVRETIKNTDAINLYYTMKETLGGLNVCLLFMLFSSLSHTPGQCRHGTYYDREIVATSRRQ